MAKAEKMTPLNDARKRLREAIGRAADTLVGLLNSEDPRIQLRAAIAILNRAGLTEAQSTSTTWAERAVGGEAEFDIMGME